jgi:hypothetical protein
MLTSSVVIIWLALVLAIREILYLKFDSDIGCPDWRILMRLLISSIEMWGWYPKNMPPDRLLSDLLQFSFVSHPIFRRYIACLLFETIVLPSSIILVYWNHYGAEICQSINLTRSLVLTELFKFKPASHRIMCCTLDMEYFISNNFCKFSKL